MVTGALVASASGGRTGAEAAVGTLLARLSGSQTAGHEELLAVAAAEQEDEAFQVLA